MAVFGSWKSPYQSREYWNALSGEGVKYEAVDQRDGSTVFFDLCGRQPVAWEYSGDGDVALPEGGGVVYQMQESSSAVQEDSYCTLALSKDDARFSRRYQRQIRSAYLNLSSPGIELAETAKQVDRSISLFEDYPDRRDNLPMTTFRGRIRALADAGLLLVYTLCSEGDALGSSLVLRSDTQVNLRYYSASRDKGAGHLLHFLSIEDMFINQGVEVVDLSGISPGSQDGKLQGIDEFKSQIGGTKVEFRKVYKNNIIE